ncbi:MAG: HD domain-containing protein [Lachnospiraceae bacterium]|nr:HD domain-containing protein [Lachnospiraceae bacterium]
MLGVAELREMLNIGIELTTEKNQNLLLKKMVTSAMDIAECDAGTLYLYVDDKLQFKIMRTISLGISQGEDGEKIDLPPVPLKEGNVCAYTAIHRELVNIPDVYTSDRFDFSGPKNYDKITGYRTGSMLVIPLEDSENVLVGVLQLINKHGSKMDPFTEEDEFLIRSLGSMAAISLSEKIYLTEVKEQMHSFVQAFATAVDERTPYNGSHTRKVTQYSVILADYINKLHEKGETEDYFNENRREQLELAATLHDIGKMIVPLSVMNKATRLDDDLPKLIARYELLSVCYERDMYKGRITKEENEEIQKYIQESLDFIKEIDSAGFMPDEKLERVADIAEHKYVKEDGTVIPFLEDNEKECLMIRKGTLTDEERKTMESHVVMTKKILDQVHFNKRYCNVAKFAAEHHEKLNGKGYPNGLTADELCLESRMLAVCDVYDALTSSDRPYKKPMPKEKAFAILYDMVKYNELEERLVKYLEEALSDPEVEASVK